ncbi:hypothetical protein N7509_010403 [Penicillium cosmopolitanum]|uniref:Eukaryotic peptide chain release factor GTP-binding subunit n=1 Tax=Penicillium cosmopolitanum TaxID=1131564 RepID=A0A9X0B4K3_9EURO|nr:uncharacterized protein N7509_010403 [Penicillium cosmopolitanum]KAJ5387862.1 hypothetical protein N7509_010403 [Penicillium cosmopolitanum]
MSNQTPDSWEDELSRQTEGVNLNGQRAQAQAPTFTPGAASFQPGAASFTPGANSFVPGQQFQQYGAGYGYPQYGQQQQAYGYQQPQQPQQQAYGQYAAYGQQPGAGAGAGYNQYYNQQPGGFQQQPRQTPVAAQQPAAQSVPQPAANPSDAPPKAKVLSIGATSSTTAPKTKVLSLGIPTPPKTDSTSKGDSKGTAAAEAGAKVTAAKAVEKTDKKADPKVAASGKSSPTPTGRSSPGRSSPARGAEAAKATRDANAVAKQQAADVDEATLKEIYGEKREHVNVVFIGHVDAGKSTLGGSLLYCTGMVDERTMEKYKREAKEAGRETWYLSWALDLTQEERSKGKTVEVGRAFFQVQIPHEDGAITRQFSILDAPGHKSYVPHMIGGASQADLGCLVISARKGEYETGFEKGGQTREHALLARNTGVSKLVLVVNKMDDPTVEWSEERFKECTVKVTKFLEALGYKKADIFCMPISAQRTIGVKDRVSKEICPWYDGPSLLEYLTDFKLPERKINAPFMMPISAKYRDMGTMCEGRIESGVIKKNNTYLMMPNRTDVQIAALYGETEDEIPNATCGDQVRMRLRGVEEEDFYPGFVLCSPKRPVHCVSAFEAKIRILDLKNILTAGFNCVLHVHSAVEEITVAALLHKLEPGTGRKSKRPLPSPTRAKLSSPALRSLLGRFTLRDQGQTIAIGMITKLILPDGETV